jgi:hypothetical protein
VVLLRLVVFYACEVHRKFGASQAECGVLRSLRSLKDDGEKRATAMALTQRS